MLGKSSSVAVKGHQHEAKAQRLARTKHSLIGPSAQSNSKLLHSRRRKTLSLDSDNDEGRGFGMPSQLRCYCSAHILQEQYFDLGTALLLDLFTGLPLAGGPCCLATFSGASSETGGIYTGFLALLPSFQGPFCPIISLQYLLLAVRPYGLLYSAYRQVLYLAFLIPRPG